MKMSQDKSIVLADDHAIFRQGLVGMLEREGFNIIGQAEDGHEAMRLVRRLKPAWAILDFSMPKLNGIDVALDIHKHSPATQVILLTMYDDDSCVIDALRAGIRGYVLKTQAATDLLIALHKVQRGSIYLSQGISDAVVNAYANGPDSKKNSLSDRERQVLHLIAEGHTTKSIADLLFISVKTAESHRSRIMQRLDIHNVANLVRYAIRSGIVKV